MTYVASARAAREPLVAPKATPTLKQAVVLWLVSFAIYAALADMMIPAWQALPVRIATDLGCAGTMATFPILIVTLRRVGPGVFFRRLALAIIILAIVFKEVMHQYP